MAQVCKTVLKLDATEVQSLKEGINIINYPDGPGFIIYKQLDTLKACRNQCKHQGGRFIRDIEDLDQRTVRCTKHFWKLNVSTMKYENPPDSFLQDQLEVLRCDDGGWALLELDPPDPWKTDPRPAEELQPGEVTLMYLTHACVELTAGGLRFMFDPWLVGPAFARGWWLLHDPPEDAIERLIKTDLIYISHSHSDHLSYPTLRLLSEKRPDVPIYVGQTSRPVFWYLNRSGVNLTNINVVPFGVWQNVDKHLRFMILMDGVHPELDTCLIVEYKGHMILNTVDCTRPNNGRLPVGVDVMLSDFAGGASGFPMSFQGGKYTESWKSHFIKLERRKLLNYKHQLVKNLQPRVYCPFAGYFTEAHPADRYIKEINIKNSPEGLNKLIQKDCPNTFTWTPAPGATLDLAKALKHQRDAISKHGSPQFKEHWEFDVYIDEINAAVHSEIFKNRNWIQFYYKWAGFHDYNLVIRMIETDDGFETLKGGYDYLVDFLDLSFPSVRPQREHAYVEIRNRVGVMRNVVLKGLLWDDLYIGFNNRISRDPDIYHHKFWNHFQSNLPLEAPDWDDFLQNLPESTITHKHTNTLMQRLWFSGISLCLWFYSQLQNLCRYVWQGRVKE
ncbi:cytidine monophosphate-N-acetylneuraminic acid hydroxylase [Hoplias malabaricus]|uniref:cytidine monophosphate-N-acetylneuraminic acid hydroxylase n=1 Tax=Hoplias malabaricus TaxID=27720 RepID=UPI003461B030